MNDFVSGWRGLPPPKDNHYLSEVMMIKRRQAALLVLAVLMAAMPINGEATELPEPDGFVLVTGGTFKPLLQDGTPSDYDVTISSFYVGKYEVTQAEYQTAMGTNPSYFSGYPNRPVEQVSWFDAIEYCNRRSMQEGLTPCYSYGRQGTDPNDWPSRWNKADDNHTNVSCNWFADGYRLPTEMEWMFAARGGNQSQGYVYSGSDTIEKVAWLWKDESQENRTHDVGQKDPNELGNYDMSGNVFEWVWDIFGDYPNDIQYDPIGSPGGSYRIFRGGGWTVDARVCAISFRNVFNATFSNGGVGFRVGWSAPGVKTEAQSPDNPPKIRFIHNEQSEFNREVLQSLKNRLDIPIEEVFGPSEPESEDTTAAMPLTERDITIVRSDHSGRILINNKIPEQQTNMEFKRMFQDRIDYRELLNQESGAEPKEMRFIVDINHPMTVEEVVRVTRILIESGAKEIVFDNVEYIEIEIELDIPIELSQEVHQEDDREERSDEFLRTLSDLQSDTTPSLKTGNNDPPFNSVPWDDPPIPIGRINPVYPDFARRARMQGTVVLEVNVYKDGSVGDIKVKRSIQAGPGGLDEAAIAAVRATRFQPGKSGGVPVDTTVIVPVEFKLN